MAFYNPCGANFPAGEFARTFLKGSCMSNVNHSEILDEKLALVTVTIKCYSGYRRATREIITELGGNLPNSDALTEGSIKVFPNERLNPFSTLRRGVFRKLSAKGVKALGSGNTFALPREELPKIEQILADARSEFDVELGVLDASYEAWFEEHVKANPEADVILRTLGIPKQVALSRFGFSAHVFKIVPIHKDGEESKDVSTIVEGLAKQLFEEVAAEAVNLLEKSDAFKKHLKAGQKTLRPIKDALLKMKGLEFLDPIVTGGVQLIEETLSALPQSGYIEDTAFAKPFSTLKRLLEVMGDVDDFFDASGRIRNGIPVDQVLFPPKPISAQVVQQQQEEQSFVGQPDADSPLPDITDDDVQMVDFDFDLTVKEAADYLPLSPVMAKPMTPEFLMF